MPMPTTARELRLTAAWPHPDWPMDAQADVAARAATGDLVDAGIIPDDQDAVLTPDQMQQLLNAYRAIRRRQQARQ